MRPTFHPSLVNGPFEDPALFIPFFFEKRALLFDMGDLRPLVPKEILKITHAFDIDPKKVGKSKKNVKVYDIRDMAGVLKSSKIKIAMIAVPPEVAQEMADTLVKSGVTGILNFSSRVLSLPKEVSISNVDMACELESLIFFAKQSNTK